MTLLGYGLLMDAQSHLSTALALALVAVASLTLSRLYFHPLAQFPGSILAAATGWYGTYYNLFMDGAIIEQLEVLHRRCGPVIRIGPNSLHFSDPKAFDSIYMDRRFPKDSAFYAAFLADDASFGCTDIKAARTRRELLGPFFSRKGVLNLENVIQDSVDRFIISLAHKVNASKPVNIHRGFISVTSEVIAEYCFAQHYDAIEYPDYGYPFVKAVYGRACLADHVDTSRLRCIPQFRATLDAEVDEIFKDPTVLDRTEHETIFHHMLNPRAGYTKPSAKSLKEEAGILVGAGTETTGNACAVVAFHVLANIHVRHRLKKDLVEAWPDPDMPTPLERLEKVPYLLAVIYEGLRFAHGVVTPLPRVVTEPTEIANVLIPKNTLVSMGNAFLHRNPAMFPNPYTVHPDRWLGRNVFRKVDLELVDTTVRDLERKAFLLPSYKGFVKAKITKVEGIHQLVEV